MNRKQMDFIQESNDAYFGFLNKIAGYVDKMNEGKDKIFINLQIQKLTLKIQDINNNIADKL